MVSMVVKSAKMGTTLKTMSARNAISLVAQNVHRKINARNARQISCQCRRMALADVTLRMVYSLT